MKTLATSPDNVVQLHAERPLRVGIYGSHALAGMFTLAFGNTKGAQVVGAVLEPDTTGFHRVLGSTRLYTDLRKLCKTESPDLVILATAPQWARDQFAVLSDAGVIAGILPPFDLPTVSTTPFPSLALIDPLGAHPALEDIPDRLYREEFGELSGLRWKLHFCGRGGLGAGVSMAMRSRPEELLAHPLAARFHLAERWFGPIDSVHVRKGKGGLVVMWKHAERGRYGLMEVILSTDTHFCGSGLALDERIEISGTCGIGWIENLHGHLRESPVFRVKHGRELLTHDYGTAAAPHQVWEHWAADLVLRWKRNQLKTTLEALQVGTAPLRAAIRSAQTGLPMDVLLGR